MTFEKGTLIYSQYTAKVKDTGEAIESTSEEEAKKLNIYDESKRYGPRLIAVGEGWVLSGLDEEIKKMDVGQKKEIELAPEKAFGARDPTQTRMVPLRKFGEREHELGVGDTVEIDNRVGTVRFIGSGRAQVDFNHRLAGKSIVYHLEVLSKVDSDDEKVKALVDRRLSADTSKASAELKGEDLTVTIPEDMYLAEGLQILKRGVANDVFKFVPTVRNLTFVEKFVNEKAVAKKEEKPAPKKAEAKPAAEEPKAAEAPKPRKKRAAAAAETA